MSHLIKVVSIGDIDTLITFDTVLFNHQNYLILPAYNLFKILTIKNGLPLNRDLVFSGILNISLKEEEQAMSEEERTSGDKYQEILKFVYLILSQVRI